MTKLKKSIILSLSAFTLLTGAVPTFAQDVKDNVNYDGLIVPYELSHTYNSFQLTSGTSFHTTISLSSSQPYGKAHFYNASSSNVTLYVEGQGTITVKPYSSNSIVWKKSSMKSNYDISVTAKSGTLNGTFSLAKATRDSEFQN